MTIAYGRMTPDELVEHFMDENGLAPFLDLQQEGIPLEDWNWPRIANFLGAFSRGYLTFSPAYLADLYAMQIDRISRSQDVAA